MIKREIVLLIGVFTAFICTAVMFFYFGVESQIKDQQELERHIEDADEPNAIKFIWNDDEESIPMEGESVKIEAIDENNVYLTPKD